MNLVLVACRERMGSRLLVDRVNQLDERLGRVAALAHEKDELRPLIRVGDGLAATRVAESEEVPLGGIELGDDKADVVDTSEHQRLSRGRSCACPAAMTQRRSAIPRS